MNRWFWGILILSAYTASFALPTYLDLNGLEAFLGAGRAGLEACVHGELHQEFLGWVPNPLLWLGVLLLVGGQGRTATAIGFVATIGACSWLPLSDLQAGYFLWLGSMGLLTAGGAWVATSANEVEIV